MVLDLFLPKSLSSYNPLDPSKELESLVIGKIELVREAYNALEKNAKIVKALIKKIIRYYIRYLKTVHSLRLI